MAKALGVQQNISTAFHPQTDGLTEQMNQWIEGYLRLITAGHPDCWAKWLPLASAVHNNCLNQTLRLLPNQILWGHEATLLLTNTHQTSNEAMEKRMTLLRQYQGHMISTIQKLAMGSGTPPEQYQVGDAVWLEVKNLKFPHQSSKLTPKHYGPFKIKASISPVAYKLQLPTAWNIHPVFHTSLLSPYHKMTAHGPNFT
jgi:hypothetical protein